MQSGGGRRKDFAAVFRHADGMFELRGQFAVARDSSPAV